MNWLDNSRVVAIFAVVFLHTAGGVVNGSNIGSEYWWVGNFYDSFVRWCVPVFVMISGALLLDPAKKEELSTFYKKRLSKILVPILFWSAFFLLWTILMGVVKGRSVSLGDLLKNLISGKPYDHMWFLYMIIMLYAFAPFSRKIIVSSTRREIIIFVIIAFLVSALNAVYSAVDYGQSELFTNRFLSYIPFFFIGHLIRTDEYDVSKNVLWCVFILSSILTAIGCYIIAININLNAGYYFYGYLSITVIPMSVSIMYLFKLWTTPIFCNRFTGSLSKLTLGVYLVHPIFLEAILLSRFGPLNFHPVVSIPAVAIFVIGSSLLTSWVIYQVPYIRRVI